MVRRMLYNAGAPVIELHRISFGGIQLPSTLLPKENRVVTQEEELILWNQCTLDA